MTNSVKHAARYCAIILSSSSPVRSRWYCSTRSEINYHLQSRNGYSTAVRAYPTHPVVIIRVSDQQSPAMLSGLDEVPYSQLLRLHRLRDAQNLKFKLILCREIQYCMRCFVKFSPYCTSPIYMSCAVAFNRRSTLSRLVLCYVEFGRNGSDTALTLTVLGCHSDSRCACSSVFTSYCVWPSMIALGLRYSFP